MSTRTFPRGSELTPDGLRLDLAPALTPVGPAANPSFFEGFAADSLVFARSLLVLSDITATRYVFPAPSGMRDPVITAGGDRLRFECFSTCNSVHARLDLLGGAFDTGQIGRGTTNVDIGAAAREALLHLRRDELLHLCIGADELRLSTPQRTTTETAVRMPPRWVPAMGNAAQMHSGLAPVLSVGAEAARRALAALPRTVRGARAPRLWWNAARGQIVAHRRAVAGSVAIDAPQRLSALTRLLPHVRGLTCHAGSSGHVVVEVALPGGRMSLGLTPEATRGFSGEGSLLEALADATTLDAMDAVADALDFGPRISPEAIAAATGRDLGAVRGALAGLAASGRVGWDCSDGHYFHRELPADPDRIEKDNPRLVAARRLVAEGAITPHGDAYRVLGTAPRGSTFRPVHHVRAGTCTCPWYARWEGARGPCKHVLAVRLLTEPDPVEPASSPMSEETP